VTAGDEIRQTRSKAKANAALEVDYLSLARFRYQLRRFLSLSEFAARRVKVTPQQHEALLAIKGFSQERPVSVGVLAALLFIRHNTAVELIDRMTALGLIKRTSDPDNYRRTLIRLTVDGEHRLRILSETHVEELNLVGTVMTSILKDLQSE
jgi:DNA-binding MarR family transcriptional regulator